MPMSCAELQKSVVKKELIYHLCNDKRQQRTLRRFARGGMIGE